jgi:GTP cyclohydrolase IA
MKIDEIAMEKYIEKLLFYIGEDPMREGLLETPARILKSYDTLFSGYKKSESDVFKIFEAPNGYDEIVLLKNIEMYSMCEHHFLPFFGKAHIAYIPNERVIGISKLARLLEIYSRRLQIQERICQQITNSLMDNLNAKAAACIIEAKHFCMMARGVEKQNSIMVTSSLKGVFITKPEARIELLNLIRH